MEADTEPQIVPNSLDPAPDSSDLGLPISATCPSVPLSNCPPEPLGAVGKINADQNCTGKLSTNNLNYENSSSGSTIDTMQINSSIEEEMQILEADTCCALAMCLSPVSFHLASDLHASLERSNVDQNGTFKHPRSNLSCGNLSSGDCASSKEKEVQQALPATCPAKPIATCPSPVFPHGSPRSVGSLDESNVAENGTARWPTSKSDCRNSRSCRKVKVSSEEGELQIVGSAMEPISNCQSLITPRRSPRFVTAVENRNGGQNSTVKKPTSKVKCGNSNLSSRSKKAKLSTAEKDLKISEINQADGDNACFFVGEPVPDEEARQRWPHHYVEMVLSSYLTSIIVFA